MRKLDYCAAEYPDLWNNVMGHLVFTSEMDILSQDGIKLQKLTILKHRNDTKYCKV